MKLLPQVMLWLYLIHLSVWAQPAILEGQAGAWPVRAHLTPWPPEIGPARLQLQLLPPAEGFEWSPENQVSVTLDMPDSKTMKPIRAVLKPAKQESHFEAPISLTMAGRWRALWTLHTPHGNFRLSSTFLVGSSGQVGTGQVPAPEDCGPLGPNEVPPIAMRPLEPPRPGLNRVAFRLPEPHPQEVYVSAQMSGMPALVTPKRAYPQGQDFLVELPLAMSGLWLIRVDLDGKVSQPTQLLVAEAPRGGQGWVLLLVFSGLTSLAWLVATTANWRQALGLGALFIATGWLHLAVTGTEESSPTLTGHSLEGAPSAPIPVLEQQVRRLPFEIKKEAWGRVVPAQEKSVTSPVSGIVEALAQEGEAVAQGQLVARIQGQPLRAPQSGVVTRWLTPAGERVAGGQPLLFLSGVQRVRVRASFPLHESSNLQLGQPVEVLDEDGVVRGLVAWVAATSQGDNFEIEVEVDNRHKPIAHPEMSDMPPPPPPPPGAPPSRPGRLSIGQVVKLKVLVARLEAALSLPRTALHAEGGNHYAYRVRSRAGIKVCERVPVSLGLENEQWVQISAGIREGDSLVVAGQEPLYHGAAVVEGEWGRQLYRNLLLDPQMDTGH